MFALISHRPFLLPFFGARLWFVAFVVWPWPSPEHMCKVCLILFVVVSSLKGIPWFFLSLWSAVLTV